MRPRSNCAPNAAWASLLLVCQSRMAAMPLELGRRLRPRSRPVSAISVSRRVSRPAARLSPPSEPVFEQYVAEVREHGRADGKTELTTSGALLVARQCRPLREPTPLVVSRAEQLDPRHRFDVADAAALPWPDSSVDLVVTSPPYGLDVNYYQSADDSDYAAWLSRSETWLAELYRVAHDAWAGSA